MAEKLKIPLNLKHKPIIYCDIQGKDSSDAKFISLGHASWNYEDFSIKIFRKPHNRWSRQSEELTPERLLSATLLLVSQIFDSSTAIAKEKIPEETWAEKKLMKRIRDPRNIKLLKKNQQILDKQNIKYSKEI